MRGAIPPLPQYSFIAWCSVKKRRRDRFIFLTLLDIVKAYLAFTEICKGKVVPLL
jgi:hypothetical protein